MGHRKQPPLQPPLSCELVTETLVLTFDELCKDSGLPGKQITLYVEEGILTPQGAGMAEWRFSRLSLIKVCKASRLEQDLGLNAAGVALALELMSQVEELKAKLKLLEPGYLEAGYLETGYLEKGV